MLAHPPDLERNIVSLDADGLGLFRQSALRGRPFAIPGRSSRLWRLLGYSRFIDLDILLFSLESLAALAQEVNVVGVDLGADPQVAFTVGVLLEAQPAIDVDLPAFRQVFSGRLSLSPPGSNAEPYRVLLHFAPGILTLFGCGDGKVANGQALLREVE
jgi:hypothetical protein